MKYMLRSAFHVDHFGDVVYLARQLPDKSLEQAVVTWVPIIAGIHPDPVMVIGDQDSLSVNLSEMQSDAMSANATIKQLQERVKYLEGLVGTVLPSALKKRDV